nr:hypothetical protein [Tanacetum cinerariifolium]
MTGDDNNINEDVGGGITHDSPYYLYPFNYPKQLYVNEVLTENNYADWSQEMKNFLFAKNKVEFVDGTIKKPEKTSKEYMAWMRVDAMIKDWSTTAMEKNIRNSVKYADTASKIWSNLSERFRKESAPKTYELKQNISSTRQSGASVKCECDIGKKINEHQEKEHLYGFLMGLVTEFSVSRTHILAIKPLPSLGTTYHMVAKDERQRAISNENKTPYEFAAFKAFQMRRGPPSLNKERSRAKSMEEGTKHYTECNKDGHTREGCFKLIGYPEWWPKNKGEKTKDKAACVETKTGPIPGLTYKDYQSIFSLCYLFRNPFSSTTMGDENHIRTLGDYSKPCHEDYKNTVEIPVGNNVDLLQKVPHHGIDRWLQNQIFYDHASFHLKCKINCDAGGKLRNKNADESWEIIENFALYDHEGWTDMKEFIKPVKAIFTPQGPSPQPQALGTTFEARVRDYMAAHTERMEHFENSIFKQREEINDRMTEMFRLLKELTTSNTSEKVLIREEANFPVTKNINSISLVNEEEERSEKTEDTLRNTVKSTVTATEIPVKEAERNNETKNKPIKKAENKEVEEVLSSRPVEYYLKHKINEKLIEGLVDNNRFKDSLSRARIGKVKGKTDNVLPRGPIYEVILKKKITKKEGVRGNFKIPYSIGGLKHVNTLVDQGSDVNVMPYSTYMKLTYEMPAETDIRLSLASHSYIYPLGIAEEILFEVAEHVYPVEFVILDIKENKRGLSS